MVLPWKDYQNFLYRTDSGVTGDRACFIERP